MQEQLGQDDLNHNRGSGSKLQTKEKYRDKNSSVEKQLNKKRNSFYKDVRGTLIFKTFQEDDLQQSLGLICL